MKYYINIFFIHLLICVAVCIGTVCYASLYDPQAEALLKLFIDCVIKILSLGN